MSILDICNNSLRAKASHISVKIYDSDKEDLFKITIQDDGLGMSDETQRVATDPFYTTRKTRSIGLGIPFFKELSMLCDGEFSLKSSLKKGTIISTSMKKSHLDRPPLGDISETIVTLLQANATVDYFWLYQSDEQKIIFDTKEVKKVLKEVPINNDKVLIWAKEYLDEQFIKIPKL